MTWNTITGYEDYEVSTTGEVRRTKYSDCGNRGKYQVPFTLKQHPDKDGYSKVVLSKNGETYNVGVHRLVALAFIPNPENKPQVNHKDGNKANNIFSNLEWNTRSENIQHRINVLGVRWKNHKSSKPVTQFDTAGNVIARYPSAKEAKRQTNLSQGHISECCRGEIASYKGYVWKYC